MMLLEKKINPSVTLRAVAYGPPGSHPRPSATDHDSNRKITVSDRCGFVKTGFQPVIGGVKSRRDDCRNEDPRVFREQGFLWLVDMPLTTHGEIFRYNNCS
jgi:hypothetical protein